jgi:hypothetical protein
MKCLLWSAIICSGHIATVGCSKVSTVSEKARPSGDRVEINVQPGEPATVLFDIKASDNPVLLDWRIYDCTYEARGKTAKFRIRFRRDPFLGAIPMARAQGEFLAVAGSENAALLEDLMKALEAKQFPANSPRTAELAFDAALLGERQSRSASGGYSDSPRGDWMTIKIFLPKGGDEGEVFLNLNPVLGKAEFSIKDPGYGDYVLAQLAKVL